MHPITAPKRKGVTIAFSNPPVILAGACIVGKKEGEGPLGSTFDKIVADPYYGEKNWERAERQFLQDTVDLALSKAGLQNSDIDFFLGGDLENQIVCSSFVASVLGAPFIGLYGACSTMYEGMAVGAMLIDGGYADHVLVSTSSHCCTAERQFRFPTESGVQRSMAAQWTVTGAGAVVLGASGQGPVITHATVGRIIDLGEGDPSDMGSAMAPAAADTIIRHLSDTNRDQNYYDRVITGDLGKVGHAISKKIIEDHGYDLGDRYQDCGVLIFDHQKQDTHAGGSGCACSATVLCGHLLKEMQQAKLKKLLGIGTGALLSALSPKQGETIPSVAHAVAIELAGGS